MSKTTNGFYEPEDPYDKYRRKSIYPNPYEPHPHEPFPPHKKQDWKSQPIQARPITIADLYPRLDRLSIGWSPLLNTLKEVTNAKPAYPPYDIVKTDESTNLLQVAVAGFTKKELSVVVQDAVLTITGKKKDKQKGEVLYQGIAARDFELKLAVAEFWEIKDAIVEDGMLTITFTKELPEEKKPKVIDIN
jgi:molecular chaperone IbpA